MPGRGNPKIVVRFDADTLAQLQAAVGDSKADNGMSGIVRQAVKEWLERRASRPPRARQPDGTITAVARIRRPQPTNFARTVACVICGAPVGTACRQNGRSRRPHRERTRDALAAISSSHDRESVRRRPGRPRPTSSDSLHDQGPRPTRPGRPRPTPSKKVMRVELYLRVERNSKFVRGMKQAREEIEDRILRRYDMKKLEKDGWLYHLAISYQTDEELDETIDEMLSDAELIADRRHCFTESDVTSLDDPDRTW